MSCEIGRCRFRFVKLTKRAQAEFLPVPALVMKIELSSPEAARVRYWLVPLIFVNAYFRVNGNRNQHQIVRVGADCCKRSNANHSCG